ncbi:hypothetical protein ACEQ8H_002085 [Pleosporales sp. CAS-2024a]
MDYRQYRSNQQPSQSEPTERQHQRFSWQLPPQEDAPAYEEVQLQRPQQSAPHAPQQPQVNTHVQPHSRHFSYAQTPVEHEAYIYMSSGNDPPLPQSQRIVQQIPSPHTPIDPRPQSVFNPLTSAPQPLLQHQQGYAPPPSSYAHNQNPPWPVSPISPRDASRVLPFSPVSPIPPPQHYVQPAPPPPVTIPQTSHARKMGNLSPINTNVTNHQMPPIPPMPSSGDPASPSSATKDANRDHCQSHANGTYSPHGFGSNQTNNVHAVFSPDAAHGPNGLDFALHQPGQIAHPNMESGWSKEWSTSLCSCSPEPSTCFTGLFCPCIVYGRTSYRLSQKSAKKDPTDMLGHSSTNGHCMLMGLSCGLWWLFPMLQRTRIRHAYKLAGSLGSDLIKACCCCCCVAVQNEREVKLREEASRRWAGPASTDVYTRTGGMVYKPQQ